MKKVFSILLAAAMLVTAFVVVAVPVSAAKGDWSVYTSKTQTVEPEADGVVRDIPGYKYTDEGLEMIPGKNENATPYGTFQTTDKWKLSDGIYLQVRVDDFTYGGDMWFCFSLWDSENIAPSKLGGEYGNGLHTTIRIRDGKAHDPNNNTTWAGAMTSLNWFDETRDALVKVNQDRADSEKYEYTFDENEKPILTLEVKWDEDEEACSVFINNSPAPAEYNEALNDFFRNEGYQAHVGFSLQNSNKGGTAKCTILKFGTDEANATTPVGDDSKEPEILDEGGYAEIADPSEVEAGQPAIKLGDFGEPTSYMSDPIVANDDDTFKIVANASSGEASAQFKVDKDISYDIKDFPVAILITRNLCTCTYQQDPFTGELSEECACEEKIKAFYMVGDTLVPSEDNAMFNKGLEVKKQFEADDDEYLYFIFDLSDRVKEGADNRVTGRINSIRFDVKSMKATDANRNSFDICDVAFFRTEAEAIAYFEAFFESKGGTIEETPTEPTTEPTTEPKTEASTKAPVKEDPTEAPVKPEKSGCGGVVGVGAIAVVSLAAAGLVSFKKKED